jgi:hypothetical protein
LVQQKTGRTGSAAIRSGRRLDDEVMASGTERWLRWIARVLSVRLTGASSNR